jgi:uncharacterized protein
MNDQKRNKLGFTDRDMRTIKSILSSCPDVKSVYLFGSRAKGNYRLGSDVDLAIMNDGVSTGTVTKLQNEFTESSLPYRIDLVDFTRLTNQKFIDHIDRVGIPFYKQGE